jgi:CheY-like chemotaxis protein
MNLTSKDVARPGAEPRILVVEDDSDLVLLLTYNLEAEGYYVESVGRGDEAELHLAENEPDLIILDWMLPGISGLEICRRLRARENTRTLPVIMVTARGEEAERVRGFLVGADDYVIKPFSVPELMARVRALLRRTRPERIADRLCAGDINLDRDTQRVRRGERDIHLGPTELSDGVPAARTSSGEAWPRVFARPASRTYLGTDRRDRRTHGRRSRRSTAQEVVKRARARSYSHGAQHRLRFR